ncbi:MAG: SusD/RagB family nutrient-binding outer membrane lipoprotein [Bacteroidetes bacterium]|nr:MAG: SusD/RagB family nutrient-binding outer membrane lipoprotein [Bacteroidota bacterium]
MKLQSICLTALFGLLLTGCTKDFADLNTDKNVPTAVTPDLLLSGVIRNTLNDQVSHGWGIGNLVAQYNAKIQFVNEDRYLWGEQNGVWNSVYGNYRNLQNIFLNVKESDNSPYFGVALIMKSWMFSLATNAYGDVPYSDAGKAKSEAIYQPKYESQETIYTNILADLKKANELLAKSSTNLQGDILYGGGASAIMRWRKLANSLRLRLLLRQSKKKNVAAEMQAIVGDPVNNPIFEGNADNAELRYSAAAPNQWPLYGSRVGSFDEIRLSKTLSDRLTALSDPRLAVFGRPTQASVAAGTPRIEGIPNGLGDVPALNFNGGPQGVSRVGYTFACLVCNDAGQAVPDPSAPRSILMNFAELQFILAEARETGLITTGVAETYYLNGIRANMAYWRSVVPASYGITVNDAAGYYAQPAVAYTGTSAERLQKLYLQKWVAMYFNGLEAWFDWRRTNSPAIVPGPQNLNNNLVPVRFPYPLSEQSLNTANRAAAVSTMGSDDLNSKMWLIK